MDLRRPFHLSHCTQSAPSSSSAAVLGAKLRKLPGWRRNLAPPYPRLQFPTIFTAKTSHQANQVAVMHKILSSLHRFGNIFPASSDLF